MSTDGLTASGKDHGAGHVLQRLAGRDAPPGLHQPLAVGRGHSVGKAQSYLGGRQAKQVFDKNLRHAARLGGAIDGLEALRQLAAHGCQVRE